MGLPTRLRGGGTRWVVGGSSWTDLASRPDTGGPQDSPRQECQRRGTGLLPQGEPAVPPSGRLWSWACSGSPCPWGLSPCTARLKPGAWEPGVSRRMAGTQTPGLLSPRGHWQHWQSSALLYSVGSQRQLSTHARRPSARVGTWGPSSPLSRGGLPGSIGGAGQEDGASLGPQFGLPEQPALAWPVLGGTGALHPSCQRLTVHSSVPEACRHALPLQHSSVPWPALDKGRQVVREVSGGQTKVNKARWHLRGHLETPPTAHGTRPCWTLAPSPAVQVWPSCGAGLGTTSSPGLR